MKNNNYMSVWVFSMILMLSLGVFSYIRGTHADFNGLTGNITVTLINIDYSSNYPDDLDMNDTLHTYSGYANSVYFIEKNMFDVPSGYVFYSWNTKKDGSGILYKEGKFHKLEENISLYAIWGQNILGDINLDGVVNGNDTVLLNKYIAEPSFLMGVVKENADVNLDGKIDSIDIDIIKQALLGIDGYKELLTNNPVFIYELYKPSSDKENKEENKNNTGGNGTSNNGGNSSNNGGNSSNNGSTSNNGGNSSSGNNNSSNVDDNKQDEDIIDNDKIDNSSDSNRENNKSRSYVWIFVVGICCISLRIIIDIIKKTVKKNNQ